jgi:protein-tyrosine phosphatase
MPDDSRPLPPPAPKDSLRIYKLCVVCLGNICRSPMAEALVRAELTDAGLADRVHVESAGTGDWHLGERGYDGSAHRARQINPDWLDQFDLLIAMDTSNLRNLQRMAAGRPDILDRIRLFRSFDPAAPDGAEVPDPYGGGPEEFARVFDIIQSAARGLVAALQELLEPASG